VILEALAAFNTWWVGVFVMNAGYWFIATIILLIFSTTLKIRQHKKQTDDLAKALNKLARKQDINDKESLR
jgi:hypothetical protein